MSLRDARGELGTLVVLTIGLSFVLSYSGIFDIYLAQIGAAATIVGVLYPTASLLWKSYNSRKKVWGKDPSKPQVAFGLYALLAMAGALGVLFAIFNAYSLITTGPTPEAGAGPYVKVGVSVYVLFLDVLLPIVLASVLVALHLKVGSAASLDAQKLAMKKASKIIRGFRNEDSATAKSLADVKTLVDDVLRQCLIAASSTGARVQTGAEQAALILIPNFETKRFVPAFIFSENSSYREALLRVDGVPVADMDKFFECYNAAVVDPKRKLEITFERRLEDFRERTREFVSATGAVYALQKRVENEISPNCMVFRDEYMREMEREEQANCRFRQIVGLPLSIRGKRAGVCLLLSTTVKQFYRRDKIFWIITDAVERVLEVACEKDPELAGLVMKSQPLPVEKGEKDSDAERRNSWISKINQITPNFDSKV